MSDVNDGRNQNIQRVTTYAMEGDEPVISNSTSEHYFFIPGNIATYETAISVGATIMVPGQEEK